MSVLKDFGFGRRIMEDTIQVEVSELIHQIRLMQGKPFFPRDMLTRCTLNIICTLAVGRRYPYGHKDIDELAAAAQNFLWGLTLELDVKPMLRYLPYVRNRIKALVESHDYYKQLISRQVSKNGLNMRVKSSHHKTILHININYRCFLIKGARMYELCPKCLHFTLSPGRRQS